MSGFPQRTPHRPTLTYVACIFMEQRTCPAMPWQILLQAPMRRLLGLNPLKSPKPSSSTSLHLTLKA